MLPEYQVCSLELSRRLQELGVNHPNHFYWFDGFPAIVITTERMDILNHVPTYTVSELLELMPNEIQIGERRSELSDIITYTDNTLVNYRIFITMGILEERMFSVNYICGEIATGIDPRWHREYLYHLKHFNDKNLANALAKLLIYLIEQGLIKEP